MRFIRVLWLFFFHLITSVMSFFIRLFPLFDDAQLQSSMKYHVDFIPPVSVICVSVHS